MVLYVKLANANPVLFPIGYAGTLSSTLKLQKQLDDDFFRSPKYGLPYFPSPKSSKEKLCKKCDLMVFRSTENRSSFAMATYL